MVNKIKNKIYHLLRKSEKWTKTDMVYLAKGGFWLTVGQIILSAAGFLSAIAFANFLPQEIYGNYKYILSILGILVIPTLSEMNTSVTQSIARGFEGSFMTALKTKIRWGTLGAVASFVLGTYYLFNHNNILGFSFLIATPFIPLMDPFNLYLALLNGRKEFKVSTKYSTISQIITIISLIATIYLTNNIFIILFVYLFSLSISRFIFLKITLKNFKLNNNKEEKTISHGKHLSLISVIGSITENFDKILMWHLLGAAPLAIYYFSMAPVNQLYALFKSIVPLATPKISKATPEILKKTISTKILKMFIIIIPTILAYIFLSPIFFKIFFPQYIESVKYSQLFILILLFFPKKLLSLSISAHAKRKDLYLSGIIPSIVKLTLLLILTPLYGISGAIFASIGTEAFIFFMSLYFFRKI